MSDPQGVLASPRTVLRRDMREERDLDDIAELVRSAEVLEVVVGLPRSMRNTEGTAAAAARSYAAAIARRVAPVPVRLVDERLSTVSAQRSLHDAGRTAKSSRPVVDAAAAVVILQSALDAERAGGVAPGELVSV